MGTGKLSIAEVNALDCAEFIARFGGIYEQSPWVADVAWKSRPFADRAALQHALQEAVQSAGRARQLELLRLHPPLGTRLKLSGYSKSEQAGAGITDAAATERTQLAALNAEYERKFGFPFIFAVRQASLPAILDSARRRVGSDTAVEFEESLRQVHRIAAFRLADIV